MSEKPWRRRPRYQLEVIHNDGPIDFWDGWMTVEEYLSRPSPEDDDFPSRPFNGRSRAESQRLFMAARDVALAAGMDADDIHTCVVSGYKPDGSCGMLLQFGFKQSNNGETVIVAEVWH